MADGSARRWIVYDGRKGVVCRLGVQLRRCMPSTYLRREDGRSGNKCYEGGRGTFDGGWVVRLISLFLFLDPIIEYTMMGFCVDCSALYVSFG